MRRLNVTLPVEVILSLLPPVTNRSLVLVFNEIRISSTEYDLGHSSIPRWDASMRAARRQGVLEVVCCELRRSSRVRARIPPVQHLLRGGYKRGLHALQGGQRHHGRFGTPEEEKESGGKQLPKSQSSRRRFGACFTLTMPESSRDHPSS